MKSWTLDVEHNEELGYFITLTDEILAESGFKIGDDLEWIPREDGSFILKKVEKKSWVLVETVQTFRHRYVVETPADHPEYALDDVTCETAKEFSQEHLGETIVSHRVISEEEALALCDQDNDYAKVWNDEHKKKVFFTREGETRDD